MTKYGNLLELIKNKDDLYFYYIDYILLKDDINSSNFITILTYNIDLFDLLVLLCCALLYFTCSLTT